MKKMGLNPTDEELLKMLEAVDSGQTGEISIDDFIKMLSVVDVPLDTLNTAAASAGSAPIDTKWEEFTDPATGKKFFFDRASGKTQWEPPTELMKGWQDFADGKTGEKRELSSAELEGARKMFGQFDEDGSGTVSISELAAVRWGSAAFHAMGGLEWTALRCHALPSVACVCVFCLHQGCRRGGRWWLTSDGPLSSGGGVMWCRSFARGR